MIAPFKYPGAKWSYAEWITSFFPDHAVYLEPYAGSAATLFTKQPSRYETINDLDGGGVNFFRVCREHPEELSRLLYFTPFARGEYESIAEARAGEEIALTGNPIEDARRFAVRCSQGFGSKLADRVGWKNTKHSAGPNNPKVWSRAAETVLEVAERLKRVQVECRPGIELVEAYNAEDCLIYADPPYPGEVRRSRIYRKEMMSRTEHEQLLSALINHRGPVILSGYENDLYDTALQGWHKETTTGRANSAAERTEVLWMNFRPHNDQLHLF